jgi:predicted CXXCH cytochrome family protein
MRTLAAGGLLALCIAALLGFLGITRERAVPQPTDAAQSAPTARLTAEQMFTAGQYPIVTGWEATPDRLDAAYCAECHLQVHTEWRDGMHAQAWSAPLFQAAYAEEPLPWCRNCHAPLSAQEQGTLSREQGITCAACHVRGAEIVGARDVQPSRTGHAVQAVADFGGSALCAGCHQFTFPREVSTDFRPLEGGSAVHYSAEPMQSTITEWQNSAASPKPCAECHGGGHRFTGPTDTRWLEQQFGPAALTALDAESLSLHIALKPRGHALPTGDPFRAIHLEVALDEHFEHIWYRARLGRKFEGRLGSDFTFIQGGESSDTRVAATRAALTATFDRPAARRVFVRLRYFAHDRWVGTDWAPDTTTARVVWADTFPTEVEVP